MEVMHMQVDNAATVPSVRVLSDTVPQSQPLGNSQVMNNAGGFSFVVDDMKRLQRFLCLGCEGGTYYVKEKELILENIGCLVRLVLSGRGLEALDTVVRYSEEGRSAKQNPTLFALAYFCRQDHDLKLKHAAYDAMSRVCRIPTHLFYFIEACEKLSTAVGGTGWGRAHRKAIADWYMHFENEPLKLAQHVTKYKNRNGWTHVDVLRLAHPKPHSEAVAAILKYVIRGMKKAQESHLKDDSSAVVKSVFNYLHAIEQAKTSTDADALVTLIDSHRLVREHMPTTLLNSTVVWAALLKNMPMTALIRNLGKMSAIGLLAADRPEVDMVIAKLDDQEALRTARIHPFNVLVALMTYKTGRGQKSKLSWTVNDRIVQALDRTFYKCFKFVEPTGKSHLLALDVSGSMCQAVLGSEVILARDASAAMAMVTLRTEPHCEVMCFSHQFVPAKISADMTLEQVIKATSNMPFGGTDCALPMTWAMSNKKKFDVFVVFTDNETWFGSVHPVAALKQYRATCGMPTAKLIVVGMTATEFTIADPNDPGMFDVAGFDAGAPEAMKNFTLGFI